MKIRSTVAALSLLALTVPAFAEEKAAGAPAGPSPAEMAAMEKAMSPGPEHQQMAKGVGDWTYSNTVWMAPGAPPMQSSGTMHAETTLGGRYLVEDWHGMMMGAPFEGRATTAYNNLAKHYESTWVDNMGTGILYSTGNCDAGGVCSYSGDMWDPMSGKKVTTRSVMSWMGSDTFKLEMYGPGPDGKEMKTMELVAKRKT